MGVIDEILKILNIKPVKFRHLNRQATYAHQESSKFMQSDPLEGIEITKEYQNVKALVDMEEGFPIIFVSGKAGTGKSTLIHYLRNTYKKNFVIVAPTGVAALNVKGCTIHSYFRLPSRIITEEDIKEVSDRKLYTKLDLLIVDEISMVRADIVDAMDKFLRKNGRFSNKPFGGIPLLLVGDLFQLPPVVTREEESLLLAKKYSSPYFFSSKSLEYCQFIPIELSKIYRQSDPVFVSMLNKVRIAEDLDTVIPKLNAICKQSSFGNNSIITLTCTNFAADQINNLELDKLPGNLKMFIGEIHGQFSVKDEKLPSPINLKLKRNAQVMFTKNDPQKRWVNGTIGRVRDMKNDLIQVELITDHRGIIHTVQKVKWESYKYEYVHKEDKIKPRVTGEYTQFPLMLAWAITIHKSQGKTLENVRIDLGDGAFAPGQVYVALSRCRSLSDITLARPISPNEIQCDQRIKRFYRALEIIQKHNTESH